MNRYVLTLALICGSVFFSLAQNGGYPRQSSLEINGQRFPSYAYDYDAPPSVVEEAIKETMMSRGFKSTSKKGLLVFRSVVLPHDEKNITSDVFVLVETKSKQEKDKSTVNIVSAETGKIPDGKPEKESRMDPTDVVIPGGGSGFLSGIVTEVANKEHLRQIGLQQAEIAKQEKKLKSLQDEGISLQKKLEKLQKDIETNKSDQDAAQKGLEKEKRRLEEMMSIKADRSMRKTQDQ